ncbi:unnamed protein product [Echinostoma caproni]|uniref:Uncharacterized protein n=1 Tax=Echinostoma caproni TaxID=27848 RepID=A0A183A4Z2_9TREM|nr:unnamed protein product [Echinostoma caproni]
MEHHEEPIRNGYESRAGATALPEPLELAVCQPNILCKLKQKSLRSTYTENRKKRLAVNQIPGDDGLIIRDAQSLPSGRIDNHSFFDSSILVAISRQSGIPMPNRYDMEWRLPKEYSIQPRETQVSSRRRRKVMGT